MPYDVQPPPSWLEDFPFPQESLDEIKTSVESAAKLPVTVEDYKKVLSLEDAAWNRLAGDDIAQLAIVCRDIQSHHLEFRMVILQAIVRIAKTLLQHTGEARVYYSGLYSAVEGLSPRPGHDIEDPGYLKMIADVVTERISRRMDQLYGLTVVSLARFEDTLRADKLAAEEAASRIIQPASVDSQPEDTNEATTTAQDLILLQNELVIGELNKTLRNVPTISATMQRMRVQFDKIRSDICSLNEQLAGPGPIPSDFLVSQPDQTAALRKWEELGELLGRYIQTAFVTPHPGF